MLRSARSFGTALVIGAGFLLSAAHASTTRLEEIPQVCTGLAPDQKPILAVMNFTVKVDVTGDVGAGMASMLANALLNSGCFTVVERERLDDVMDEQALGLSGAVEEASAPDVGRIKGSRFHIMGEITEFSENESGFSGAAGAFGRIFGRRLGSAGGAVDVRKAHVGFIVKIVDTSSAILIGSKSFDMSRSSAGLAGAGWRGRGAFAGAGQISQAMADAIEEGLIAAIQYIAPHREQMLSLTQGARAGRSETAVANPGQCALLQTNARPPRVMVVIPEEHILGDYGAYAEGRAFKFDRFHGHRDQPRARRGGDSAMAAVHRMIRPPDPAGETEIVKRFIEHGFHVVDEKQMEILRAQERFLTANDDVAVASAIGSEFGADIVIAGEAFSEFSKNINGMMSCRSRVEAKAIETRTGRIIAADGLHASAIDVSEVIAGKSGLRNAGGKLADYFITQICADKQGLLGGTAGATAKGGGATQLIVSNIDFTGSSRMQKALGALEGVSSVEKTAFRDATATFRVMHRGSTDDFAAAILAATPPFAINIVALEGGRIVAAMK